MKRFLFWVVACICVSVLGAQPLKFNSKGNFKIVQFTDLHYIYEDKRAAIALECIDQVMQAEKPDLVVLTGDVIYGKPADKSFRTVLDKLSSYKIPFAITFGNHDDEQGMSRQELLEIAQSYPMNRTATEKGISGTTNYTLPVYRQDGQTPAAVIYCIDSHSYSQIKDIKGYDYIKQDQIAWYARMSRQYQEQNGGAVLPSYFFFHIPLPEYAVAASTESVPLVGSRTEKVCAPALNSGLFAMMKERGDARGVFVGHDHDNDYAVYWNKVLLAYGRYSGGNTVYNNLSCGARVIELSENDASFKTWIRLQTGEKINELTCPASFVKK